VTVLAGYDVVIELSQAVVQELVLSGIRLDGQSLRPATEIERTMMVSVGAGTIGAKFHALIRAVAVDVGSPAGANGVTLAVDFHDASIEVGPLAACKLEGQITVDVPLAFAGAVRRIVADLPQANATVTFSTAATGRLTSAFGPFANQIGTAMRTQLEAFIRAMGPAALGPAFAVDGSQPGTLGPPPRFTAADLVCLYSTDRSQQRLCLLAMVRQAPAGDPATKTDGLPPGCAVAVHASPSVVHSLICDSLAGFLGATPPGSCGGSPVSFGGATIDDVTDALVDGAIDVRVSATSGGFCYTASGTIPLTFTPTVANGRLSFTVTQGTIRARVDVPWYCTVVAFVVNILGGVAVLLGDALADSTAVRMATTLARSLPQQVAFPASTAAVPGIASELRVAQVTPGGLTLASAITVPSQYPPTPFVGISTRSLIVKSETVAENDGESICGDEVRIHAVEQRRWYETQVAVQSRLHGRPLEVRWDLECPDTGDVVSLTGTGGVVDLSVDATYGTLLSTTVVRRRAQVTWSTGPHGTVLNLRNDPADGSFLLDAKARVTNCSATLQTERTARLGFQGHVTEVTAPGLRQCLDRVFGRFIEIEPPVPWPQLKGDMLGPEVFEYLTRLGTSGDQEIHTTVEVISVLLPTLLAAAIEKVQTAAIEKTQAAATT
jgi:hypothetical protein